MPPSDHAPIPTDAINPAGGQLALTIAMGVLALCSITYAIAEARRRGDLLPIYLVIGAGLAVFYEPLGDHLVHVYYPEREQATWITSFGLDIPVYIGLLYFWYMPLAAFRMLRQRRTGVTTRGFWTGWVGTAVFFITFEIIVLAICGTTWIYYGTQAFMVGDVPVLTPVTYAGFSLAIAVTACLFDRFVPQQMLWLLVPTIPAVMGGSHMVLAMPLSSTLWTTTNESAVAVAAVASAALTVIFAYGVSHLLRAAWFTDLRRPEYVPSRSGQRDPDDPSEAALRSRADSASRAET